MSIKKYYKDNGLTLAPKIRWKIIITCITFLLGIFVLIPIVSGLESDQKFYVRIQPLDLDFFDVKFHPIEADGHYNYGEKVVEKFPTYFDILKKRAAIGFLLNWERLHENLVEWSGDADFDDYIAEMNGIRDAATSQNESINSA